jgi:hypothetical protein
MLRERALPEADRHWLRMLGTLNEFQARLFVAERALQLGQGGIAKLSRLTGMSPPTVRRGIRELTGRGRPRPPAEGRQREFGGGRKRAEHVEPGLLRALTRLVEDSTAGDPMSPLRWTSKSTRALADELTRQGYRVNKDNVARCLHELGYALQANVKTLEGRQHPDRDAQFRYLSRQVRSFFRTGDPVISVDTKKKELVGKFAQAGRTWRPSGQPEATLTHDFIHQGKGKAVPYGAYDVGRDQGFVNVGISHDTAEFAVESVRRWWRSMGRPTYPNAKRLLICADAGGSNGPRLRAWKAHLQRLSNQCGFPITCCHYPPGTSKWNKIEHRLFSFISMNWRGCPLVSFETVVNLIASTRTRSGLKVKAALDTRTYEKGVSVSNSDMAALKLRGHAFHPDWNYDLVPQAGVK